MTLNAFSGWILVVALAVVMAARGEAGVRAAEAPVNRLITYPAPAGVAPSADYSVEVNDRLIFVYSASVLHDGPASFAYFDFAGSVSVKVSTPQNLKSAVIRPLSAGVKPAIAGDTISFTLDHPCNLSVELNGGTVRPLFIFANPVETDVPKPGTPHVIYFGPGVHEITVQQVPADTTVYIAGGAVVRAVLAPDEKPINEHDWSGQKVYKDLFTVAHASNVTFRGRGILDMSALTWHARTSIACSDCTNLHLSGFIMLDSAAWDVALFGCKNVHIDNIKQICSRENSDGIDICNTQDVVVENCFLRNNDDEVCVKCTSPPPAQESRNIVTRRCVIWNDRARGLGITSETRANISNVLFEDCDIIHDFGAVGDCGALAVLVSDSGTISDIRFENIRVEDCRRRLFTGWIGTDMWGHDPNRGHVDGVTLKNIVVMGSSFPDSSISGYDSTHLFENVAFDHLRIQGKLVATLAGGHIALNPYCRNITVSPAPKPPAAGPKRVTAHAVADLRPATE